MGNTICGCHRFYDGVQHISGFSQTTDGNFKNSKGTTNYCELSACSYGNTGATPGILAASDTTGDFTVEFNYNDNLGNLSELSDCSDRGLDNGDGECECF